MKSRTILISAGLWIAKLGIVGAIFWYLLHRFPAADIVTGIAAAELVFVIAAVLLTLLWVLVLAYQLQGILRQLEIPVGIGQLFGIHLSIRFYGLLLPGEMTSGAIKWYKLGGSHSNYPGILASIILSRLVNMAMVLFFGSLALLIDNPFRSSRATTLVGIGIMCALVSGAVVFRRPLAKAATAFFAHRSTTLRSRFWNKLCKQCLAAIAHVVSMPRGLVWRVFMLAVAAHALNIVIHYILALSVGITLSIITIAWVASIAALIRILPISIAGLGIREGLFVFLLGTYAIAPATSIAYSLIIFGVIFITGLMGGLLEARHVLGNRFLSQKT